MLTRSMFVLGQISWADCLAFIIFLTPQLFIQLGIILPIWTALSSLPYLCFQLPAQLLHERYFTRRKNRSPFVQKASLWQDLVIRVVRYAFAYIPASVGRVFFSKGVALPFLRFRLLRNFYWRSPIQWREINADGLHGLWMIMDTECAPDIVIYYAHGGGFSMGSSYFYLEFLLVLISQLKQTGFRNPAIFSLEYTLVPDAAWPTQLLQAKTGYDFVTSIADSSRVCIAGDSAGATVQLSLLRLLSKNPKLLPAMVTLISPWTSLRSEKNVNTSSDYLDADSLGKYARQYLGNNISPQDMTLASPGDCKSLEAWQLVRPSAGFYFVYGQEEVFAPEIRELVAVLRKSGTEVITYEEPAGIHAWPIVNLFLGRNQQERERGVRSIVSVIRQRMR